MSLRFKRYYPLIILLVAFILVLTLAFGSQRIIAYSFSDGSETSATTDDQVTISNEIDLFDESVVHSIQVEMSADDYDTMISTYQETGEKDYFSADVTIDGVRIENVGIRLKGNASLQTALGGQMNMGGNAGNFNFGDISDEQIQQWREQAQNGDLPAFPGNGNGQNMQFPGMNATPGADGQSMQPPDMGAIPQGGDGQNMQFPGMSSTPMPGNDSANGDNPAGGMPDFSGMPNFGDMQQNGGMRGENISDELVKLPFMIKFDEFVEGQTYQGRSAIAIRNYGTSYDAAMLQEPVTNDMVRLIGLPATDTAYTGFKINDDSEDLYVISEVINEEYLAKYFENANGVLYKAELGSSLSYLGDDPSSYSGVFTQQTRVNDADLSPLIDFMRFLDESDDATFEAELGNYLDVDSFATYLAVNNLLVNTDSIAGMNNNYYLYYDEETGKFTLLMWDANESLGKLAMGSQASSYDIYYSTQTSESDNAAGGAGMQAGFGGPGGGMMGGPGGGSNSLVERFMATDSFVTLYEQKLQEIYQQVYLSGAANEAVNRYAELVRSAISERSLTDLDSYNAAVESTLSFLDQRATYLATTPLLGSQASAQ